MNKKRLAGAAALILLGFFTGACSDRGPVGLYSKELFNREIPGPQLAYYSDSTQAGTLQITQNGDYPQLSSGVDGSPGILVNLVNKGGSSTFGAIAVTFTILGADFTLVKQPYPSATGVTQAYYGQDAKEIPANSGAALPLSNGYNISGVTYMVCSDFSFQIYFNYQPGINSHSAYTYSPVIQLLIKDPLRNTWHDQFRPTIYVNY